MTMKSIYFNSREGQTVLSSGERKGLLLKHISLMKELDEAEQANIQSGLLWLESYQGEILTESFFRRLHRKLFGSIWKWAGVYRSSEKNIGVAPWAVSGEVQKLIENTKYWISHDSYSPLEIIARFHHRLVQIHPFPNGNGRFSRILTNRLCDENGWQRPTWGAKLPPVERRKRYIEALRAADDRHFQKILAFFAEGLESSESSESPLTQSGWQKDPQSGRQGL